MSLISFNETLAVLPVDGPAVSHNATNTEALVPFNYTAVLPNGYLKIGRVIRCTMMGEITQLLGAGNTIQFNLNLGAAGTVLIYTLTTLNVISRTFGRVPFVLSGCFTVRLVGTGTSSQAYGIFTMTSPCLIGSPVSTQLGGNSSLLSPSGTPVASVGYDYSVLNILSMSGLPGNTPQAWVRVNQWVVESLN